MRKTLKLLVFLTFFVTVSAPSHAATYTHSSEIMCPTNQYAAGYQGAGEFIFRECTLCPTNGDCNGSGEKKCKSGYYPIYRPIRPGSTGYSGEEYYQCAQCSMVCEDSRGYCYTKCDTQGGVDCDVNNNYAKINIKRTCDGFNMIACVKCPETGSEGLIHASSSGSGLNRGFLSECGMSGSDDMIDKIGEFHLRFNSRCSFADSSSASRKEAAADIKKQLNAAMRQNIEACDDATFEFSGTTSDLCLIATSSGCIDY